MELRTAKTRYGFFRYYDDDMFIGKSLEAYGEYCQDEVRLWEKFIQLGDVVIDVGANIGALTIPLAQLVGVNGRVIAIEPQPENFVLLEENIDRNGWNSVVCCFNKAASSRFGDTVMVPGLSNLGHKNYGRVIVGTGDAEVGTTTIDELADFVSISFMKIDVEGFEAEVIRGARETIKRCRPVLYVENDRPDKSVELIHLIRSFGYRVYEHRADLFSRANFNGNDENVLGGDFCSLNVLCIPEEYVEDYIPIVSKLKAVIPNTPSLGKNGWAGIARFGGIGDNLMAASVLPLLKKQGYKIEVLSQSPQACVFDNNPYIDKLTIKDPQRDLPQGDPLVWQNWFRGRAHEYDLFVHLSHSCENLLACFPASTQFYWPDAFRRKQFGKSYLETVHDIVGVPHEFGPLFFPTGEELEQALITKRRLSRDNPKVIAWCISGTRIDKVSPHSPTVISRLIKELGVHIVMLGAPNTKDFDFARQIQEYIKNHNGSDAGLHLGLSPVGTDTWPIRRILTFPFVCDLVISPDTGPAWAVAFEPVKKLVLLGHSSPENITKGWVNTVTLHADRTVVPCWPCHCLHDAYDTCREKQVNNGMVPGDNPACISSIGAEVIVNTVRKMLGE